MCGVCGCGEGEVQPGSMTVHRHDAHQPAPPRAEGKSRRVQVEQDILSENARYAITVWRSCLIPLIGAGATPL